VKKIFNGGELFHFEVGLKVTSGSSLKKKGRIVKRKPIKGANRSSAMKPTGQRRRGGECRNKESYCGRGGSAFRDKGGEAEKRMRNSRKVESSNILKSNGK